LRPQLTKALVMSSDASQSILRLTLLACATAAFMVMWAGDSSQTVGMTLAQRNNRVFPAHAVTQPNHTQMAQQPQVKKPAKVVASSMQLEATPRAKVVDTTFHTAQPLPGGSYRVVFEDGRVEWLTVIDRNGESTQSPSEVITRTINGERAHLIRVSTRPMFESTLR
jgi:hypothetical protein